jgi:hypothetical protein
MVKSRLMETHRVETVVRNDRTVVVDNLPFDEGETVEVIIVKSDEKPVDERYPLRDTPYTYTDPFEPAVQPEDWDALT